MSRKKGNRIIRRKAIPYYEEKGCLVDKAEKTGRYRKDKDLFAGSLEGDYTDKGFDLVAIKEGKIILIQVTCNQPKTQKWYREFAQLFANERLEVHVYTWYDNDGERIQNYKNDGSIEETDNRR